MDQQAFPVWVEQPLDTPLSRQAGAPTDAPVAPSTSAELMGSNVHSPNWRRTEDGWIVFKAVPDSGAQVSVASAELAPGFQIKPNAASREGRGFISASKHAIPCVGELDLPTQSPEGHWTRQRWQVTPEGKLAKPLMSIGCECDQDQVVVFHKKGGAIVNQQNGAIRRFPRLENGSYEIEMYLPPQSLIESTQPGFTRPGR